MRKILSNPEVRTYVRVVFLKKGKNILAMTIEKIFPKLEEAVILIYFDTLAKAFRPSLIPSSSTFKSFFSRTTSICLNIVLAILVIVMFVISTTGSRPTILNYEKALQNRYASWEQELNDRENAVREKERQLMLDED